MAETVLVTGAGGFIGGHLVRSLEADGFQVRAVDVRPLVEWQQQPSTAECVVADLSDPTTCRAAVDGIDLVYNLAADMGGMGFIETHKALCMLSVLINTNLLVASRDAGVGRYFFSSSACVYAEEHQRVTDVVALKEEDAYPAMPEDGYGWEKLFSERMCRHFEEDFGIATRVARYHNVYGPYGTWQGGREKAPAAISRKVAQAVLTGDHSIEIWGDGEQTRSFMYIDDCVKGTRMITEGTDNRPVNLGSNELVSINDLVSIIESFDGVALERRYDLTAPKGVRGRNSDNTEIQARYGWQPSVTLVEGLATTYQWVKAELQQQLERA